MVTPAGLTIGGRPRKPQWRIGRQIGSGACASVHALDTQEGQSTNFVVKVVYLPTKITKNKESIPERNARLLNYEELLYRNIFPEHQGFILPKLPISSGPPVSGDIGGFRFLVMEAMKGPLWDVIPALLKSSSSTIDLAPIAQRLLECVRVIHEENHLVIDVKPENFMIAYNDCNGKERRKLGGSQRTAIAEDLAGKVRILDLGLVVPWKTTQGHRPDEGISEVVGTPLYASRNVHQRRTPSRRDDVEALGYVVSELIARLVAAANGISETFEGAHEGDIPTYLPWSQEKSDDDIGVRKAKQVGNIGSTFYKNLGGARHVMKAFFDLTQGMKYKERPDYEKLDSIFATLTVTVVPPMTKTASRQLPRPCITSRARRSNVSVPGRAAEIVTNVKNSSSKKKRKVDGTMDDEVFFDAMEVESIPDFEQDEAYEDVTEQAKEENVFEDAVEAKDKAWGPMKENGAKNGISGEGAAAGELKTRTAKSKKVTRKEALAPKQRAPPAIYIKADVLLTILGGPHKGETYVLAQAGVHTIYFGSAKSVVKKGKTVVLDADLGIEQKHARFQLVAGKKLVKVAVTDLSESGTFVNGKKIQGKKEHMAFVGDRCKMGDTVIEIKFGS